MTTFPKLARHDWVAAQLDATKSKRFDLTADLTVDATGWPTDQVVTAIYTQPATGGPYSVTYAGQVVPVAATGSTAVEWTHDGTDWDPRTVPTPTEAGRAIITAADVTEQRAVMGVLSQTEVPSALDGRGLVRPVRSAGRMLIGFGSEATWTDNGGAEAYLTRNVSGFDGATGARTGVVSRTGRPTMLQWAPTVDAVGEIVCGAGKVLTPAINGQIVLVVHVAGQPGYQPGNVNTALKGSIALTLTTHATRSNANALNVNFNVNQLREGWNFLKFVMRNPNAYTSGSGVAEDHPFGVSAVRIGTGADTNIRDNPITGVKVAVVNMGGATLTFDSIWTGIDTQAQIVLGCDQATSDTINLGLPLLAARGWVGYTAFPVRMLALGQDRYILNPDASGQLPWAKQLYAAGWDTCNHSANHLPGGANSGVTDHMASLTDPAAIAFEVEVARQMMLGHGLIRGAEFYASPQSQSSRLSERVIRESGFRLQRHSRKCNVTVTPWGVDNLHHIGAIDMGSSVNGGVMTTTGGAASVVAGSGRASRIIRQLQVIEAYGDTVFPFWHALTAAGGAEDLVGDNITMTQASLAAVLDHIEAREAVGALRVTDGLTGWFYGIGR